MPDYSNSKIYFIECNKTGLKYIGSTTAPTLARRLAEHRNGFRRWKEGHKNFVSSFKVMENDDYDILLLEIYPCNWKDELHTRERYYIQNNECVNKSIPLRTGKEYYVEHKEEILTRHQKYREENKDLIKQQYEKNKDKYNKKNNMNKSVKITCDCGIVLSKGNMSHHIKTKKHINLINSKVWEEVSL